MIEVNPGTQLQHVGQASEWTGEAVTERVAENGQFASKGSYRTRRAGMTPKHRRRVLEAGRLMANVINCQEEPIMLQQAMNPTNQVFVEYLDRKYPGIFIKEAKRIGLRETMSYSDYSALTVDIIDRMLYEYYNMAKISNMPLVKKHTLRDFRLVARYAMDGAVKPFSRLPNDFPALVPHGAGEPPTERAMQQAALEVLGSTQRVTYQPQLYQGMLSVNWRAFINDDLGIFRDMTQRLAGSGNRTIYSFITGLYVSAGGWNSTLTGSVFKNTCTIANGAATNNPPLSYQALLDAYTILNKQLDLDGQPIDFMGSLYLYHGPSLNNTAISMAKATNVGISVGGGTTNTQGFPSQWLNTPNWPMEGVIPIQDKYIPLICTTSGIQNTMWALIYDPPAQPRPTVELGQLAGFEDPQLFQKVPNTMRIGGGVDPSLGDFWTMNQDFKGILVLGGTQIDGRSAVFSTGAGS
jgi:hypothetical protein